MGHMQWSYYVTLNRGVMLVGIREGKVGHLGARVRPHPKCFQILSHIRGKYHKFLKNSRIEFGGMPATY